MSELAFHCYVLESAGWLWALAGWSIVAYFGYRMVTDHDNHHV